MSRRRVARTPSAEVAIVGAGVIGLSCAYFLARRGAKVVVLERTLPGAGSSTRNGGGVRSQLGTATNVQLSVLSEPYWAEFEQRVGVDPWLRRIGYLFLAADEAQLQVLRHQVELQHEHGVQSELLVAEGLSAHWPMLNELGFAGGSYCRADGYLNQHRVVHGLARAAEHAGATIECGVEVVGFDVEADRIGAVLTTKGRLRTEIVVNCAGAWAPHLAERIGFPLPIRSRRVQLLHAHPSVPLPRELPWLIGPLGQVHVRQEGLGRVQVGGFLGIDETVDALSFDHDADPSWISGVLEQTRETFGIEIERSSVIASWAGLYPSTPDQHPIIDRTEAGMVVVGGFAGLGLMHAPAAGLLAAELILDGEIRSVNPADVSLARFSRPIEPVERTGF
jgi:glycine/D-amino acid oxidase-like deaminating enzyme